MKRNYRKAFNALKKIDAPVIEGGDCGEDTFRISAEHNTDEQTWADYHGQTVDCSKLQHGICNEIVNILKENKLFAEWINPGVLGVYDA